MATENVIDWLSRGAVIDPVNRSISHDMKLREFIPKVGNSISLWYDLPNDLYWGMTEKSVKYRKSGGNAYTAKKWFDRLPIQLEDCIQEAGFGCFIDTLPRVQGRTLPSSILALMERWMDTTHTFHLLFDEITITSVDFTAIISLAFRGRFFVFADQLWTLDQPGLQASLRAAIGMEPTITPVGFAMIIGLPFRGRFIVFDDQLWTLDQLGLRTSLRAAIGMEPTISDKRVHYESIIAHYEEMPPEFMEEMDVDMVPWAFLFYLLSTTLFKNHGNDADLALLPPLQDLDVTRQYNYGAIALSYLYYKMNLYVRGAHLKVGYTRVIEIWACKHQIFSMLTLFSFDGAINKRTLPRGRAWRFSKKYAHATSDISALRQMLNVKYPWGQITEYPDFIQAREGYSCSASSMICTTLGKGCMGGTAFVPGAYAIVVRTQLLVHVPPPTEIDAFVEAKELDRDQHEKRVRRGFDFEAPDTAVIIGTLEHGSFIFECTGRATWGMLETHLVSIANCNEVCQLYEAARLKLAMARLSDEHISLWAFKKIQVMNPPSDHLMSDYKSRVYVLCYRRLTGNTVENWTAIFQDLTTDGFRLTCPWWYIERVTVSFYLLCMPLCRLTMAVAYYPNRVARQFGWHQAVPDHTLFEGGLITQQFLSRFISTWPSHMTIPISDVVDTSSSDLYHL
ncbi:hypothetical protein JCGZ_03182 [Jatropha curcas]|uniref:Aminotransferase-like plant mobile domain-containing protein n=1 Tax=Jatropha curcas TaxID=180498 RepID=A0A067JR03_JATCU|nr:hypothetical protein JCGZ_03182 [Jatropha curcas]